MTAEIKPIRPPPKRISRDVVARSAVLRSQPPRNPFVAPSFPPLVEQAVKNAGVPTIAMDDAIASTFGWAAQDAVYTAFAEGTTFLGYSYLATLAQRAEYRVVTEVISSEMTREWVELKIASGDESKSDKKKQIEDRLDNLNAQHCFRKVAESDGFFGRGHLYLDTGCSDDPDELITDIGNGRSALSKVKIGPNPGQQRLLRLQPVEASWAYPTHYESIDPLKRDWYSPSTWYVMARQIHKSRFLTLIGREVPDILKPAYAFGGLSMSQMLKPYVDNWLRTRQSVSDLIQNFSHVVLHTNLDATTAIGGDELFARVALFNNIKTNQGTVVIDKEAEDLSNISVPLGGLDHLQAQAQEHLSSISRIPLVKLLGIQPAGLNASSEGELIAFEDWIAAFQNTLFRPAIRTVIDLIQLSLWGEVDDDITFDFKPLRQMKPIELAQLEATKAQTREIYVQTGAVDASEVREVLAQDPDAPFDGVDLDKPLAMPPGGAMGGMFGGMPGGGGPEMGGPPPAPGGAPGPGSPPGPGGGQSDAAPAQYAQFDDYSPYASYAGDGYAADQAPADQDALARAIVADRNAAARRRLAQEATPQIAADQAPVTAYHGTRTAALQSIIDNGLLSHPFKHYHPSHFYEGERGASVYVTENPEIAKRWALSEVDDPADVTILQLELPRDRLKADEEAPEAERFLGDIPPAWIKSAYPLQRDGTFGAAIPLHHAANDDLPGPPGAVRYTVLHHHNPPFGIVQDADPDWDENKVKRSSGGQFAKSAGPKGEKKETKAKGAYAWKHVAWTATKSGYKKAKGEAKYTHPETGHTVEIQPGEEPGTLSTQWTHTHGGTGKTESGQGYKSLKEHMEGLEQGKSTEKAPETVAKAPETPVATPETATQAAKSATEAPETPAEAVSTEIPPSETALTEPAPPTKPPAPEPEAAPTEATPAPKDTKAKGQYAWKHVAWTATKAGYKKVKGEAKYVHPETGAEVAIHPGDAPGSISTNWTHKHGEQTATGQGYKALQQHIDAVASGVPPTAAAKTPTEEEPEPPPEEAAPTKPQFALPDGFAQSFQSGNLTKYTGLAGYTVDLYDDGEWYLSPPGEAAVAKGKTQAELDKAVAQHVAEAPAPTEAAPTEATHGPAPFNGKLAPPAHMTPDYQGGTLNTYADQNGVMLLISDEGKWTLYPNPNTDEKLGEGTTQAELDKAVAKHTSTGATHGAKPYPQHDLAPPTGWGKPTEVGAGYAHEYEAANGDKLYIHNDGEWMIDPKVGTHIPSGKSQQDLDEASAKSLGTAAAAPSAVPHGEKPFPQHDIAPPGDNWFNETDWSNADTAFYKDPDDHALTIDADGSWELYNHGDDPAPVAKGMTQADLDAAIIKHYPDSVPSAAAPTAAEPTEPKIGNITPPKGIKQVLPHVTKYEASGQTFYSDAKDSADATEQVIIKNNGEWQVWQKGEGITHAGSGQDSLNQAFEDLHPRDEHGHFIKVADQGGAAAAPTEPTIGNITLPPGTTTLLPHASKSGQPGKYQSTIYSDAANFDNATEYLQAFPSGTWSVWQKGQGIVANGTGQESLHQAFEQLHPQADQTAATPAAAPQHNAPAFPGQPAPPKGFDTLDSQSADAKTYTDAHGNSLAIFNDGYWALYGPGMQMHATSSKSGTGQEKIDTAVANLLAQQGHPAPTAPAAPAPTPPAAPPAKATPEQLAKSNAPPMSKKALANAGFVPTGGSGWSHPSGAKATVYSDGGWWMDAPNQEYMGGGKKLSTLKTALAKHAPGILSQVAPQAQQAPTAPTPAATQSAPQAATHTAATQVQPTGPVSIPSDIDQVLPHKKEYPGAGLTLYHDGANPNDATEQVTVKPDGSWAIWQQNGQLLEGKGQDSFNQAFESLHPRDENGHFIKKDKSEPSGPPQSHEVDQFTDAHKLPPPLNGVAFDHWTPPDDWTQVEGTKPDLTEPPISAKPNQHVSSGVLIQEPDGRVWLIKPKGGYGGVTHTFPKGQQDAGLSLQQNAIKEGFEESGLKVEITGFAGDYEGTTSVTRYYFAKRVGGTPTGYKPEETEQVVLVPPEQLKQYLNQARDHKIADAHFGTGAATQPTGIPGVTTSTALSLGQMTKVGKQLGSNLGGQYEAPDGTKYYVKQLKSDDHVNNEMLAAALYRAAGGSTFEYSKVLDDGKLALATKWQKLAQNDITDFTAAQRKAAQQDFAIQAWLGNRDAAGEDNTNIGVTENGKVVPTDLGGSLLFRAMGSPKTLDPNASEWETLRDKSINRQTHALYGDMTDHELRDAANRLKAVTDQTIDKLVAQFAPSDPQQQHQLAQTLKQRRDAIIKKGNPPGLKPAVGPPIGVPFADSGGTAAAIKYETYPTWSAVYKKRLAHSPVPTQIQANAIYKYTDHHYDPWNKALRESDGAKSGGYDKDQKQLDAYLALASTPEEYTVKRRVKGDYAKKLLADSQKAAKTGNTHYFTDHGYASTDDWHGSLTIQLTIPQGARVAAVGAYGKHPNENEILISRGSEFRVTGIDTANATIHATLVRSGTKADGLWHETPPP